MSAQHWEARRRQAALERRRRAPLPRTEDVPERRCQHGTDASAQAPPPEPRPCCCRCSCHYPTKASAKLPRRFSAVQYMQQW